MPPPQTRSRLRLAPTAWSMPAGEPLAGDPGEQVVVGDPVGALDEDRPAVDDERERRCRARRASVSSCDACAGRSGAPRCRAASPSASSERRPSRSCSGWPRRSPRGHHSAGCVDGDLDDRGRRASAATARRQPRLVAAGRTASRELAAGDRSRTARRRRAPRRRPVAVVVDTVTSGRTDGDPGHPPALDARTGCQRPAVCRSGPQSQPKLQAILRTMFSGCG